MKTGKFLRRFLTGTIFVGALIFSPTFDNLTPTVHASRFEQPINERAERATANLAEYNVAIEKNPGDAAAYFKRGEIYLNTFGGNFDYRKAHADFTKAIELNPNFAAAYIKRSFTYVFLKENQKALADLNKALELEPDNTTALEARANFYKDFLEDPQHALEDYNRLIQLKRGGEENAEDYYERAQIHASLGDTEKSIADLSKAVELDQEFADAYSDRALAYMFSMDFEQATADLDKAIALRPDNYRNYFYRGMINYARNNAEQAAADFKNSIELNPEKVLEHCNSMLENADSDLFYALRGFCFQKLGDMDKAEADFAKVVELKKN